MLSINQSIPTNRGNRTGQPLAQRVQSFYNQLLMRPCRLPINWEVGPATKRIRGLTPTARQIIDDSPNARENEARLDDRQALQPLME
jgi:hypothetical protein